MTPWLSKNEIDVLCGWRIQHAAQINYLIQLGIPVRRLPNGAPLVMRIHFEQKMKSLVENIKTS